MDSVDGDNQTDRDSQTEKDRETDSLLHDLRGLGPGTEGVAHVAVAVMEACQVHEGVDVLVVVVPLSWTYSLEGGKK